MEYWTFYNYETSEWQTEGDLHSGRRVVVPNTLESMNGSAYFFDKCVCEEYFRDYIMLFQQIDIIVQNSQIYFVGIV